MIPSPIEREIYAEPPTPKILPNATKNRKTGIVSETAAVAFVSFIRETK